MDMVDDAMNEIDAVHIWVTYLLVGTLMDILVVQRIDDNEWARDDNDVENLQCTMLFVVPGTGCWVWGMGYGRILKC